MQEPTINFKWGKTMSDGVTWEQIKSIISFSSPLIAFLAWIFTFYARDKKERLNEINEIKLKQHELELKMTGDFLKKDEFNTWVVRLDDSLRRIHERLDRRPTTRQKEE